MKKVNIIRYIIVKRVKTIVTLSALLTLATWSLTGCQQRQSSILGDWINPDTQQGIQIATGGLAASILNPEVQYTQWSIKHHQLVLQGKMFKDNSVSEFSDTLRIVRLNSKQLVLANDSMEYHYIKH